MSDDKKFSDLSVQEAEQTITVLPAILSDSVSPIMAPEVRSDLREIVRRHAMAAGHPELQVATVRDAYVTNMVHRILTNASASPQKAWALKLSGAQPIVVASVESGEQYGVTEIARRAHEISLRQARDKADSYNVEALAYYESQRDGQVAGVQSW